jgi:hypothetical protein
MHLLPHCRGGDPLTKQGRVLLAIIGGAETCREIEAATNLPLRLVAAHVSNLERAGVLELLKPAHYPDASKPCRRFRLRATFGAVSARSQI